MEDPLIEKNNGLNDMSADDGGSSDLDETEDQGSMGSDAFTTPLAQYKPHDDLLGLRQRRRTEAEQSSHHDLLKNSVDEEFENSTKGSVGSDAFTPLLEPQYKPRMSDYRWGLFSPRASSVPQSMSDEATTANNLSSRFRDNDYLDALYYMISTPTVRAEARTDCYLNLGTAKHTEVPSEDDLINSSLDLGGVDIDSQTISPRRTVIATERTEVPSEGDLINSSLDLGGVDIDSQTISPRRTVIATERTEVPSEDDLINSSLDLGGVDIDSQTISPRRTVIATERTEMDFELILVIITIALECMSAIFTELSSEQNPHYALIGMILSYFAFVMCIIEIIYEVHQQIPIQRGSLYNNRPQRGKSFATFTNIVALVCALCECAVTTIRMEDHLIEKNNGLNGMSADDGGSSDLDDELGGTEGQGLDDVDSQMISSPTVISAAGTEGRVGGDAFIKLVRYYRALNTGLRQRRRRTNVSYSEDDQHQENQIQNDPLQLMKRPSMTIDLNSFDQPVEPILEEGDSLQAVTEETIASFEDGESSDNSSTKEVMVRATVAVKEERLEKMIWFNS
ncbi:hypothetical protein LWI29_030841 [Acer saccharum]|uniref:Uncharacterized protein n=1 Tax=Acer saccharum TaxID=4024 RepID=A0AA39VIJ1_ACESA|nr:hypothetical protein LWI29_030841 [Acer saccharum]